MLDKKYDLQAAEAALARAWSAPDTWPSDPSRGLAAGEDGRFVVMMPPPNVTGSLHIGHALNHTLQDVLTRTARRRGVDTLWQPGTDHAGIATQMVVERQLAAQNLRRQDLGREAFLERVWQWKAESGGQIVGQLHRLGTTPHWARERFTMDEGCNAAVRRAFVTLYRQGLIYRDKQLVNWDPKLKTAISDLEIDQREVKGQLWHLRYPVTGQPDRHLVVATTRPETMLGDTAVAVHPEDERFADLIGRTVTLPLTGREIPVVADDYADPQTGSGAVKITPAHDFNDFEVGRRHRLPFITVMDEDARILARAEVWQLEGEPAKFGAEPTLIDLPAAYAGLDRFTARTRIVADLEAAGLLEKIDDHPHTVPHGDRGGVPVEPRLTDQWYCDAATLAKPAIAAVEDGRTRFVPEHWAQTYFQWMHAIRPWCISRQLWWGHQIPAWYGPDGAVFVAETAAEAEAAALAHYGADTPLARDPDVLDTWFSSGLWPFSTLGWPEQTPHLAAYYPGTVLVTAFDIIFFWVARMMMLGIHFMGEVPFRTVYIHALVRDEKGRKMSKSEGNVIDPLAVIGDYGADALRMTLTALAAQGRDIKLSLSRVESYRNFTTKLWNAARYGQLAGAAHDPAFDPAAVTHTMNRWIVGEVAQTARRFDQALAEYRFNEAADALYQFAWGTYCDWYLEFTKPILRDGDPAAQAETKATTAWALDQILSLLNPIMPFVTETLWQAVVPGRTQALSTAPWPSYPDGLGDAAVAAEIGWVVRVIQAVRTVRAEMGVSPAAPLRLVIRPDGADHRTLAARLATHGDLIASMARLEGWQLADMDQALPGQSAQVVLDRAVLAIPLAGVIDLAKERERLSKEIARQQSEVTKIDRKLGNPEFMAKAPEDVVAENQHRREEAQTTIARLQEALARIADA